MIFGSVCSGIEAASVAWEPLGWRAAWFAEIEPFPCSVLLHHWPEVPNLGDMTRLPEMVLNDNIPAPDVLVGGTPCQAFSVAGRRESLDDERGQLTLSFTRLADEIDNSRKADGLAECIIVWENVPGVLSTKDNAFGCFLGELSGAGCELQPAGKRWGNAGCVLGPKRAVAWRVLDAQYFGVAQRRRRVFVVASARDGFDPASVLFEFEGVRRDTAPSRETGEGIATSTSGGSGNCEFDEFGIQRTVGTLCADTHPGSYSGQDAYTGRIVPQAVTMSVHGTQDPDIRHDQAHTLGRNSGQENAVITQYGSEVAGTLTARHDSSPCHDRGQNVVIRPINTQIITRGGALGRGTGFGLGEATDPAYTLQAGHSHGVWHGMQVRRLTPVECERLQGFPDNHTSVPHRGKPAADGPRYKAIGNSMAVPVMRWIGQRIKQEIEK